MWFFGGFVYSETNAPLNVVRPLGDCTGTADDFFNLPVCETTLSFSDWPILNTQKKEKML